LPVGLREFQIKQ